MNIIAKWTKKPYDKNISFFIFQLNIFQLIVKKIFSHSHLFHLVERKTFVAISQ